MATASAAAHAADPLDLGENVRVELVDVPAGQFVEGGASDSHTGADEGRRTVRIRRPFAMGKTLVTVAQFRRFVQAANYRTEAEKGTSGGFGWNGSALEQRPAYHWKNPGFAQSSDDPVVIVTYNDAIAFTNWASRQVGRSVRLPTEAEWEWAVGAGAATSFFWGNDASKATEYCWFFENAGTGTHPVGKRRANARGIADAVGNVWQWCRDYHGPISGDAVDDPWQDEPTTWAQSDKPRRVLKGGSWLTKDVWKLRTGARNRATEGSRNADFGFRVVVTSEPVGGAAPPSPVAATPPPANDDSAASSDARGAGTPKEGWSFGTGFAAAAGVWVLGLIASVIAVVISRRRKPRFPQSGPLAAMGVRPVVRQDGFTLMGISQPSMVWYRIGRGPKLQVLVQPNSRGAFIYTGQTPRELEVLSIVPLVTEPGSCDDSAPYADPPSYRPAASRARERWPSAY